MQGGQGSLAVRTEGSGALVCVRLIHLLRGTLFWFKVDSAQPGVLPQYAAPGSPLRAGAHGAALKQEVSARPCWARCGLSISLVETSSVRLACR